MSSDSADKPLQHATCINFHNHIREDEMTDVPYRPFKVLGPYILVLRIFYFSGERD